MNWFRKGADGSYLWPGFGENMRVLKWMIDRCEGHGGAAETPIGYIPRPEDFDLEGLDITRETMRELFANKPDEWKNEIAGQQEFYDRIDRFMTPELSAQRDKIAARFAS